MEVVFILKSWFAQYLAHREDVYKHWWNVYSLVQLGLSVQWKKNTQEGTKQIFIECLLCTASFHARKLSLILEPPTYFVW